MELEWSWKTLEAIGAMLMAAVWAALSGGNPFAMHTVLYRPNTEGKYVIQSEGVRLAFTLNGGSLANLWINDTQGIERDIVLGFDSAKQYQTYKGNPYLNGIIGQYTEKKRPCAYEAWPLIIVLGRYAGVISGAGFNLGGVRYNTSGNGNGGSITSNGGEKGWGRRTLDVASHTKDSIVFVVFDREWMGFPGTPAACITHTVTPYEWHIAIGLTPVRVASPINLSQQVFWNLDGFAPGSNHTVAQHKLWLPHSGLRFDFDEDGVPTGDIKSNARGSALDFWSKRKTIRETLLQSHVTSEQGPFNIDETFMVAGHEPKGTDRKPAASLASEFSGIKVDLFTDQEALHVHSWKPGMGMLLQNLHHPMITNLQPTDPVRLKKQQGQGQVPNLGALSMEMLNWPDAINHPEWQRKESTIWGPEALYTTFSSFKFSVNHPHQDFP
jgi:aldose 1-epimerase